MSWPQIEIQTKWKLEPLLRYSNPTDPTDPTATEREQSNDSENTSPNITHKDSLEVQVTHEGVDLSLGQEPSGIQVNTSTYVTHAPHFLEHN